MATDNTDNRGWYGDPEGHARAGREGGKKVASERGREFFEEIGRTGGQMSPGNFKNDPARAREAGRKGGQARGNSQNQTQDQDLDQEAA